ncbi:MAG: ribosome silencing factor [Chloroflexota bacterium]
MQPRELARLAAQAAIDKKAEDTVILDIANQTVVTDFFVICTGGSKPHVQAIVDGIEEKLKLAGITPRHIEGYSKGQWVLLDYVSFVVHVFVQREREFYGLERLWGDAEVVEL